MKVGTLIAKAGGFVSSIFTRRFGKVNKIEQRPETLADIESLLYILM